MRCYDQGQQIEVASHIKDLIERKGQAKAQRGMSRLMQSAPASQELLNAAGARGENLGSITAALLRLVERYGAPEVQTAVLTALARGVPYPNAVRLALETQREARHAPAAAFNNLAEQEELTRRYQDLCNHYGLRAPRCNPGQSNENGSIELRNDSLARRFIPARSTVQQTTQAAQPQVKRLVLSE